MEPLRDTVTVREASGLPRADVLREPERAARVARLSVAVPSSAVLPGLVRLAGRVAGAACAQLSLLADRQTAVAVQCAQGAYTEHTSALEDSLCTVTVLSGDVLLAADARRHPWLHDLPPVVGGAVGSYLGVPLRLQDGSAVGALCVYGPEPRAWSDAEVGLTCEVADLVAVELQRLSTT
ncbi:MAG: putative sensor protein [Frankiales bacterium]|nr:putative sensor protein [Frankiales bacterium]